MKDHQQPNEFEQVAASEKAGGILREIWAFMRQNKKWWLLPIIMGLLAFGLFIILSGTAVAPFIYTLF